MRRPSNLRSGTFLMTLRLSRQIHIVMIAALLLANLQVYVYRYYRPGDMLGAYLRGLVDPSLASRPKAIPKVAPIAPLMRG
jgi:hypothetical protein